MRETLIRLTRRVSPMDAMNLKGKEESQTFNGLDPAVCLVFSIWGKQWSLLTHLDTMRGTMIMTGIKGRASWAMFSLGTPASTSFSLKIFSAAEKQNVPVSWNTIQTNIFRDQSIFKRILYASMMPRFSSSEAPLSCAVAPSLFKIAVAVLVTRKTIPKARRN